MAHIKVFREFKNLRINRPMLDGIVGSALQTHPNANEVIIRCIGVTTTALDALNSYSIKVTIVPI